MASALGTALSGARKKRSGIKIKPSRRGSLHRALGYAEGEQIPSAEIDAKLRTATGNLREKLQFAKNARGFKH